ncbi:MAG TPA: MFS transporter [Candidatus Binatia bacterium]|nr:MFS transporter [Candidatus Binatia bacterium]
MTQLRALTSLQHRDYRLLWFGHIFTSMAFWMDQVSRGWLIYELTDSTVQLGLVRGVQAIPILLLSPIAGSAADRYSRKTQILVAQIIDAIMFAALALLIFAGEIQPWHVYVTAFGMAIVQTFQQPARAAIISDVVPTKSLTNAIGLNSIIFNVARSTGPALAGVLIAGFGTGGAYGAQAAFYFLATFWTLRLRTAEGSLRGAHGSYGHGESFAKSIVQGWKFSWRNENVRTGLLVTMLASLFIVPFVTLLPVFARDILDVGATGQGLLLTAMGVGALGSAVIIATFGDRMPRGLFMLGGVALYGVSVVAFAVSPWFQLSMVLMIVVGFANVCSHALVQTVIQTYSPREFRGRAIALFHMGQVVMTLGSMAIGSLAAVSGTEWAVVLMGTAGALAMLAIHIALPQAWRIR